jgi:hypothetical protein
MIDIILPVYNPNEKIYEAIGSVINQTYKFWHLYIIDDASKYNILDELKEKYKTYSDKITYFQFQENKRAAACRNYALGKGKGELIAFIDQDDVWLPNKLELQVNYMKINNVDAVHGNVQFIDDKNHIIMNEKWRAENQSRREVNWNLPRREAMRRMFLIPNIRIISSMVRREIFENIGGFKDQYFGGEDFLFWFEISAKGKIGFIDEVLFKRRIHDTNTIKIHKMSRIENKYKVNKFIFKNYTNIINDIYFEKIIKLLKSLILINIKNKSLIKMFKYIIELKFNYIKLYLFL